MWKLASPQWHEPEMLYYTFQGDWASPIARWLLRLGLPRLVWGILGWTVIIWEASGLFALQIPRIRVPYMLIGVSFHVANWVLLDISEFMVSVVAYPLFFRAETLEAWADRITQPFFVAPQGPAES
jgi:hypothetical protein